MIELAIATDFGGQNTKLSEIKEILQKISKAGFSHVHWCHEWDGEYLYSVYEMEQIKQWLDEFNLKAKSLHASKGSKIQTTLRKDHDSRKDFTSLNEFNRNAGVELIKNRIDLAYILNANEIVLHMYVPYMDFIEKPGSEELFYIQAYKSLDELVEYASKRNICICLETLLETPMQLQYELFDQIFKRYNNKQIGLCLDTGHVHVVANEKIIEFALRYQDRLVNVHINDNLGGPKIDIFNKEALTWCCDLHWIPGDGTIDFEKIAKVIAKSPYELPLVLELNCYEENIDLFLERSYEAGIKLTKKILEKRKED